MKTTVIIDSDEYGAEEFDYDSVSDALEGLTRLAKSAVNCFQEDGVVRSLRILPTSDWREIRGEG